MAPRRQRGVPLRRLRMCGPPGFVQKIALTLPAPPLLSHATGAIRRSVNDQEVAVKLASVLVVSACAVAFVGCTIKGPEVRLKPPVEVKVEKDHDRDGRFCPPGQAKKGKC